MELRGAHHDAYAQRAMTLLLLATALGIASTASAKGPIGELTGMVLDSHGKPVADATVTMQSSDGKRPYATHTDASGHFKFARYETGQYDLRAYSNGMFSRLGETHFHPLEENNRSDAAHAAPRGRLRDM